MQLEVTKNKMRELDTKLLNIFRRNKQITKRRQEINSILFFKTMMSCDFPTTWLYMLKCHYLNLNKGYSSLAKGKVTIIM